MPLGKFNKVKVDLEHINCDLCGSNEYRLRYRKPDNWLWLNQFEYPIVECCNCHLVFVNPRPTSKSMSEFYPQTYHYERDGDEWEKRYAREISFLPQLNSEAVLDIGCARGEFLKRLKAKYPNIETYGVDPFSEGVDGDDIKFYKMDFTAAGFASATFDIITAWAVFEHLHEPGKYFDEVRKTLKKNGRFIFLVTNSESFYGTKAYAEDIPRHLYHFSARTLDSYAEKFGFRINKLIYDDSIWDGRGYGTFAYLCQALTLSSWDRIRKNNLTVIQRNARKLGRLIDKLVFTYHWEKKFKRSGIMICEFEKQ